MNVTLRPALALAALTALALLIVIGPVTAQEQQRIAAVVNDEILSMRDLRSRLRMVIVSSRLPPTDETAQRLAPQVLRSLVDEQIQLQEAKRLNVAVTEQDLARARSEVEQRNNLKPGQFEEFVRSLGVDPETVIRQLKSQVAWTKLVRRRFGNDVTISQEEVTDVLQRMEADAGKTQKRVSEIVLTVDDPSTEDQVRQLAERIVEQLKAGANFSAVARQFSASANAAVGGDVGWILPERMAPEIAEAVAKLETGQISEPVRTLFGYHIVQVADSRVIAAVDPLTATVDLKQVFLPVPPNAGADVRPSQKALAEALSGSAQSCGDFVDLAKEIKSPVSPDLGEMKVGELAPPLRERVAGLKAGENTGPVDLPNGVMVVMVCSRQAPPSNLPSQDQIRSQLEAQRFEILAQRYLRDLRRNAFVELRV
ncbi:peptidylprolyl isomerase [Thalassobaculum sp.]|uniref:peptidylprolyl isomerase n=1 Tax=Thalassobaculum sp. TaxID=2022740 RepID=UPI0032EB13C6